MFWPMLLMAACLLALLLIAVKGSWIIRALLITGTLAFSIMMGYMVEISKSQPIEGIPDGEYNISNFIPSESKGFIYIWATTDEDPIPKTYRVTYSKEMHKGLQEGIEMTKGKGQFKAEIKNAGKLAGKKTKESGEGKEGEGDNGYKSNTKSKPSIKIKGLADPIRIEK